MLRIIISKLKHVYATALIPKILKETKTAVKKDIDTCKYLHYSQLTSHCWAQASTLIGEWELELRPTTLLQCGLAGCSIDYFSKAIHKKYKSTDSGSKDDGYAKRKAIIDQCFSEKTPVLHETDTTTETLPKDKIKLCNSEDKSKSFISKIFGNNKIEQKVKKEEIQNADVQSIAAKIEEVKLAHDTIQTDETLNVKTDEAKDNNTPLENRNVGTNTGKVQELAQNFVQIDRTPQIEIDGAKVEEPGTPKVSALLQHTNVQTTTGIKDDEKLAHKTDKTPHVEETNAPKVSEALQKAELKATAANVEQEKFAQEIVHIDKTPLVDIRTEKDKDLNATLSVSQALQKDEDRAIAVELEREKLAQHTFNIAKDNVSTPTRLELEKNANVKATTAKIEEEKLAQKIDHVDETPHVEAGVDKIEGFNVSPKVLGNESSPNLSISEANPDHFSDQPEQVNLDELAKKCLGKPDGDVDQILLKELKNMSQVNSVKFDLPKDDSSQKYFSQILQDKTKDNNNIVFDISDTHLEQVLRNEIKGLTDNEMTIDNFHPFHLDTVPIVTSDTRDYNNEFNRNISPDGVKNILLDIPAVLDPYDMQAIPFYQYVTKENVLLKELQHNEAPEQESSTAEIIGETEINAPMNEEVILKREEESENIEQHVLSNDAKDTEEGATKDRKVATTNAVEPLPEIDSCSKSAETSALSESDISKLLEYKNVLTAQQEAFGNISPNNIVPSELSSAETNTKPARPSATMEEYPLENATQTVLTTSTPTPTDPFGNPIQSEAGQIQDKRSDEMRTDTAISSHQEPDEYFPTNQFNSFMGVSIQQVEYEVADSTVTYTGVFDSKNTNDDCSDESTTNNLMSQSISYYSTFPQLSDFSGNSQDALSKSKHNLNEKERITHVLRQPKPKQENIREELVQPEAELHNIVVQSEPIEQAYCKEMVQPKQEEEIQTQPKREGRVQASAIKDVDITLSDETVPLSVLLRRVRERNRLETIKSVKMEAKVAKKPPCLTPLDRSKPKTTMHPSPCKPKPKENEKEKCPSPCKPPEKKDPCAKFIPFFIHTIFRSNLDISIPPPSRYDQIYTYIALAKEIACKKLKHLSHILGFLSIKYRDDEVGDAVCARDFKPWVPIPSWPIPKVERKRTVVCPQERCKLPVHPIRSNTDKPCLGVPKKISPSKTVN